MLYLILALLCLPRVDSVELDLSDIDSVCNASRYIVDGELNYYLGTTPGGTVGMFSEPYYWWQAGDAFGGLVIYYSFCQSENSTLRDLIVDGMYHQAGSDYNYVPSNQSLTEGNDDQGMWGMAVMEAAERNLTDPSSDHSWISLAQAIYNTINARWDESHCDGGLRWQIFTWNSGYDYKNTISNSLFFQLSARLARYTDNQTYVETAEKVWDWVEESKLMNTEDGVLTIYDGVKIANNCSAFTKTKWSYTYGTFISGCAYLYNYTLDDIWKQRALEIINEATEYFVEDGVMSEVSCANHCDNDQRSFRSLLSRCLGIATVLIPEAKRLLNDYLSKSALAAAQSCSGGTDGVTCGENWTHTGWDGVYGLGEQMSSLEVILANVQTDFVPPLTVKTGASNKTNAEAGINTADEENYNALKITHRDKVGAIVLTVGVVALVLLCSVWMVLGP